ncbi:MAG: glycosyltransferase [Candidatus Omnitrophota bacterium]
MDFFNLTDRTDRKIDISIIICVYNGGEFFKKNIESAGRLKIPDKTGVEFLFVDNNSTDGSGEIIKEYARKSPGKFRYLFEPTPGKSYALNLAIREAGGEILAFTDADTILPEDWLLRIKDGFEKHDCVALGGKILPAWETRPPAWLVKDIKSGKGSFGLNLNEEAGHYSDGVPSGANNAVKKEVFLKYGCFRTDLGPRAELYIAGEDTEFFRRIILGKEKIFYYPPMTVYHQIPSSRFDKRPHVQNNFLSVLRGLRSGTKTADTFKTLLAFPEIIFKLVLSGLGPSRIVSLSAARYRGRLYKLSSILSYKLFGEKKTIRLARILRIINREQEKELIKPSYEDIVRQRN